MIKSFILLLERFAPLPDLSLRLWVAWVFFKAGLTKIVAGTFPPELASSTLFLFEYEYKVPLLPFELAAYMGTYAELIFPIFLAIGLGARWAAGALFVFNIIAVLSYPGLTAGGIAQHQLWGLILLYLTLRGPGKLSLDHIIRGRFMHDHMPKP